MDSTTQPQTISSQQQQPNSMPHYHHNTSVGPVIGVLSAVAFVGIVAGVVGRLCSGRSVLGYGGDCDGETWVETKCSSCVDGYVGPPHPPPPRVPFPESGGGGGGGGGVQPTVVVEPSVRTEEVKTEEGGEQSRSQSQREYEEGEDEQVEGYNGQNHEHFHS